MTTCEGPGTRAGVHGARSAIAGSDGIPLPHTARPNKAPESAQRDLRFRRDVLRLHSLGPRVLFELFAELGARRLLRTEIEQLVGCYAALDPEIVRAIGADRLPPLPPPRLMAEP